MAKRAKELALLATLLLAAAWTWTPSSAKRTVKKTEEALAIGRSWCENRHEFNRCKDKCYDDRDCNDVSNLNCGVKCKQACMRLEKLGHCKAAVITVLLDDRGRLSHHRGGRRSYRRGSRHGRRSRRRRRGGSRRRGGRSRGRSRGRRRTGDFLGGRGGRDDDNDDDYDDYDDNDDDGGGIDAGVIRL